MGLKEDIEAKLRTKALAKDAPRLEALKKAREQELARQEEAARLEPERQAAHAAFLQKIQPTIDSLEELSNSLRIRERLAEVRDTIWHSGELARPDLSFHSSGGYYTNPKRYPYKPSSYIPLEQHVKLGFKLNHPYLRLINRGTATYSSQHEVLDSSHWKQVQQDVMSLTIGLDAIHNGESVKLTVGYSDFSAKQSFDPKTEDGNPLLHSILVDLGTSCKVPREFEMEAREKILQCRELPWHVRWLHIYSAGDRTRIIHHPYRPPQD